jgi:hypothetical protein
MGSTVESCQILWQPNFVQYFLRYSIRVANLGLRICEASKFIFTMSTEFLKLAPHLVYITWANRIIRNNELERLGQ